MSEPWREIVGFKNYQIHISGLIQNLKTERTLTPSRNQQGHLKVNLVQDGVVYTKGLSHLVAKAHLEPPRRVDFISVIHLDGDKSNCDASNLEWRPRYFAIRYHLQFDSHHFQKSTKPIIEPATGWTFPSAQDACIFHGLLLTDLLTSIHERTYVWPTYQEFRWNA